MAAISSARGLRLNKSTNVRLRELGIASARLGMQLLTAKTPRLAARYAEHLFLTPHRYARPGWERRALLNATSIRFAHEGTLLPAWVWGPSLFVPNVATVVLVHGWEGRGSQLSAYAESLVRRGFRVVTFDGPGHGDAPDADSSFVDLARALVSLSLFIGPAHAVIAHSVGGAAALLATRFGFTAERFALIAPPVSPERFVRGFSQALGLADEVRDAMFARLEEHYELRVPELDVRKDAATVSGSILVVHDTDDRAVPLSDGKAIADTAKDGRFFATSGLGHHRILRDAESIAEVTKFVAEGVDALALKQASFSESLDGELYFRDQRR